MNIRIRRAKLARAKSAHREPLAAQNTPPLTNIKDLFR